MNRREYLCALTGTAGVCAGCTAPGESRVMLGVDTTLSISETSVNKNRENFVSDSDRDLPQSRDDGPPQVALKPNCSSRQIPLRKSSIG
jgi:hypothetical protein